jgi:translation initiation factor 2 gamma subunit (eIF-2gamma)
VQHIDLVLNLQALSGPWTAAWGSLVRRSISQIKLIGYAVAVIEPIARSSAVVPKSSNIQKKINHKAEKKARNISFQLWV